MASVRAAEASSATAPVTAGAVVSMILVGDLVGGLQRLRHVRVVGQRDGRVGYQGRPPDVLGLQLLGLRRADAEHLAHAEQRRRLGAGEGDHRRAQLGFGQLAALVDQQLLHHHLAAGADRAGQALRLGADALVVDADRTGDGVLGGRAGSAHRW